MTELRWEDPETVITRRYDHEAFARELKKNPGRWAVLSERGSATTAHQIRNGRLAAYRPAGAFEATTRGVDRSGAGRIHVRYVGEASDA